MTLSCMVEEQFDLVVLSVGMEISESVRALGKRLGVELDEYGFCHTVQFNPIETSRPGIYAVGPFREPKDIPESVVEASGAAAASAGLLADARWSLTRTREYVAEHDVAGEEPRIGVFVCHCGSNIAGFLDVPAVTEYARTLPHVVHAEDKLYACSQDSIALITQRVKEHGLNRVVVASCTPLTHQPLFQDSIRNAGLNPYLFEMANIRNQCSWVHSHEPDVATEKAKDLVRMSVARAALLEPQHTFDVPVKHAALIVGGGVAGMTAALSLAEQGFPVHLIEKEAELGGNLRQAFLPSNGKEPQTILTQLVDQVQHNSLITVHLQSHVIATSGFMGNFVSTMQDARGKKQEVRAWCDDLGDRRARISWTRVWLWHSSQYHYATTIREPAFESEIRNPKSKFHCHDPMCWPGGEILQPHLLHRSAEERHRSERTAARSADRHSLQRHSHVWLQGTTLYHSP